MSRLASKKPVGNGKQRADVATRFKPGNQAAVGRSGLGWLAQMRVAMQDRVPVDVFMALLDAQVEKAADGDTAAFLAVRDTVGLKPKDEVVADVRNTILDIELQAALIEVQVNA